MAGHKFPVDFPVQVSSLINESRTTRLFWYEGGSAPKPLLLPPSQTRPQPWMRWAPQTQWLPRDKAIWEKGVQRPNVRTSRGLLSPNEMRPLKVFKVCWVLHDTPKPQGSSFRRSKSERILGLGEPSCGFFRKRVWFMSIVPLFLPFHILKSNQVFVLLALLKSLWLIQARLMSGLCNRVLKCVNASSAA